VQSLPFTAEDATAGVENELQAVVVGAAEAVDLPIFIKNSRYYKNLIKKTETGDTSPRSLTDLQHFIDKNADNVWENSWVRFPRRLLTTYADQVFERDLFRDKRNPNSCKRRDVNLFSFCEKGEEYLRVPISYLLKLALADTVAQAKTHPKIRLTGEKLLKHFLSDNTSPETYSFFPVPLSEAFGKGKGITDETSIRFLLCQLLIQYANKRFQLEATGQKAMIYFAPHPPIRQKMLNDLISDQFYREIFMSPCLSGWDRGEDKYQYMNLCHRVLSVSQLNAVAKLKEAGIINTNLVVLPNTSNTCLANNGTHISLGSRKLTGGLADAQNGFRPIDEKYYGDLAIKIIEHFIPLFVGTYSAAPFRFDFWDFHPEKVLSFLPHELDFTHLRMIWRRWKKKANLKFMGQPLTPFGPEWLDRWVSKLLGLKGDYVYDFRLIDYLVSLLSTEESPAMNGVLDNEERLKNDLASFGIFDAAMPLYVLYRLRQHAVMGYSGFEGRFYSLFNRLSVDMESSVNLQMLLTALAYKYILKGEISHKDIPDSPFIESERRQILFGTAVGIPTFFIHQKTANRFMIRILKKVKQTRFSRRYKGYIRVHNLEYRKALVTTLREDAKDLIDMMGMTENMKDLEQRVIHFDRYSTAATLAGSILEQAGAKHPLKLSGYEFNMATENYYRNALKKQHMSEALLALEESLKKLDSWNSWREGRYNNALLSILEGGDAVTFLQNMASDVLSEKLSMETLMKLICLTILVVDMNANAVNSAMESI
jgi:hypothetical protein